MLLRGNIFYNAADLVNEEYASSDLGLREYGDDGLLKDIQILEAVQYTVLRVSDWDCHSITHECS